MFEKPLIYCHFAEGIGDPKYNPIHDWAQIKRLLDESLSSYNDLVASMNLVLFEDAMYHICRLVNYSIYKAVLNSFYCRTRAKRLYSSDDSYLNIEEGTHLVTS